MARTGIEPATQGFSVLRNRFLKLPSVTLNQPRLLKSIGKGRFFLGIFGDRRQSRSRLGNWQLRQYYGIFFRKICLQRLISLRCFCAAVRTLRLAVKTLMLKTVEKSPSSVIIWTTSFFFIHSRIRRS